MYMACHHLCAEAGGLKSLRVNLNSVLPFVLSVYHSVGVRHPFLHHDKTSDRVMVFTLR